MDFVNTHNAACPKCGAASDGATKSCSSCGAVRPFPPFLSFQPPPYIGSALRTLFYLDTILSTRAPYPPAYVSLHILAGAKANNRRPAPTKPTSRTGNRNVMEAGYEDMT